MRTRLGSGFAGGTVLCLSALVGALTAQDRVYQWNIPSRFPKPHVPAENSMSSAKVELGRRLFYDTRLSVNGRQSCATCHRQELAFTDGRAVAVGATGERHPRGSMSLANVAYNAALTWPDSSVTELEQQALIPMFGTAPIELGLRAQDTRWLRRLQDDSLYRALFRQSFAADDSLYSVRNVVRALAAFQRTLISMQSPYDRYRYHGDTNALSASAKRGEVLFFSGQRAGCFQCHGGWNFSGPVRYDGRPDVRASFFNTGLYNLPGPVSYPPHNTGLHAVTARAEDVGKFRVPTLRNVAVTAPYMHDGSVATLSDVLDHYAAGGRTIASGPHAGVGSNNPNKARMLGAFSLSATDKRDLIAFLESLTDSTFLNNPAFANPWK